MLEPLLLVNRLLQQTHLLIRIISIWAQPSTKKNKLWERRYSRNCKVELHQVATATKAPKDSLWQCLTMPVRI